MDRRSAPQSIAWFLDLYHGDQLDLSPAYQRRSVWNDDYRKYFVDTILRNYPSPAVFLEVEITETGRSIYHVVDGKQRLSTIIDFRADGFSTSEAYSDNLGAGNAYYSDLDEKLQKEFLKYLVPVEFLEDADSSDLEQAFDRLNRNVAKLTPQELRHARFSGAFISLMENLADDPFWIDSGIATPARIRRMQDIEFVSELFILTMHGVQEGKESLDEYYAQYDEEVPELEDHRRRYETCKATIQQIWPHLAARRFRNLADFYSLWAAVLELNDNEIKVDPEESGGRLSEFGDNVLEPVDDLTQRYLVAVTQGTNKVAQREERARILLRVLTE